MIRSTATTDIRFRRSFQIFFHSESKFLYSSPLLAVSLPLQSSMVFLNCVITVYSFGYATTFPFPHFPYSSAQFSTRWEHKATIILLSSFISTNLYIGSTLSIVALTNTIQSQRQGWRPTWVHHRCNELVGSKTSVTKLRFHLTVNRIYSLNMAVELSYFYKYSKSEKREVMFFIGSSGSCVFLCTF